MDLERKEERTYCGRGSSGGVLRSSGTNRLMQRPNGEAEARLDDGGNAQVQRRREEEEGVKG